MSAVWFVLFYQGLLGPLSRGEAVKGDYLLLGMMPVTFIFAASAVTLVVVSLVTKPMPQSVVDRFIPPSR
jgi:hypothetical protein